MREAEDRMKMARDGKAYRAEDGSKLEREHGKRPNGEPMHGWWVYRDAAGQIVDYSPYVNDLAYNHGLHLTGD